MHALPLLHSSLWQKMRLPGEHAAATEKPPAASHCLIASFVASPAMAKLSRRSHVPLQLELRSVCRTVLEWGCCA